jgi:RNA polymerase sigma factor (sigma-70 family)
MRYPRAVARLGTVSQNGHADETEASDDRVTAGIARAQLLAALATLPARDRDVVVLVAWEELTYEEVAAALDIPLGTVRSRLNRARCALRELLPEIGNEPVTVNGQERGGVRHAR